MTTFIVISLGVTTDSNRRNATRLERCDYWLHEYVANARGWIRVSADTLWYLVDSLEHLTPAFTRLLVVARSPEGVAGMAAEAPVTRARAEAQRSHSPAFPCASSAKSTGAAEALLTLVVD